MILFVDTETSGLVQNSLPHSHPAQPSLVQLGLLLCEEDGSERASFDGIVSPEGAYQIPRGASDIHGITTDVAERVGLRLATVVGIYRALRRRTTIIAAHNLPFDERVMATAIHRSGVSPETIGEVPVQRACTMEMAEPVLRLPPTPKMLAAGMGDMYKKPNLGECVRGFFGEEIKGAHTALADCRNAARVYFHIKAGGGLHVATPWLLRVLRGRP